MVTFKIHMKHLYTLLAFVLFTNFSLAQRPSRGQGKPAMTMIKGVVIDQSSQSALEFATISIFAKKDSSLFRLRISSDR